MKVVCAWCGKTIKEGDSGDDEMDISHGICEQCAYELEYQSIPVQNFIDSLPHPVIIVDSDTRWQAENKLVLKKIGKTPEELKNKLHGDIIECIYTDLPGGCGKNEHCSGCGIKRAVEETYTSGKPQFDVSVFQYLKTSDGVKKKELTIHTKKVDDTVVVIMDGF